MLSGFYMPHLWWGDGNPAIALSHSANLTEVATWNWIGGRPIKRLADLLVPLRKAVLSLAWRNKLFPGFLKSNVGFLRKWDVGLHPEIATIALLRVVRLRIVIQA